LSYVLPDDTAIHERLRFARAGITCGFSSLIPGMLVREPVHGMQGALEKLGLIELYALRAFSFRRS
jgi:hypothetical protein